MKKINRFEMTAQIPFKEHWQRKAIASLYSHAGIRIPNHLLPPVPEEVGRYETSRGTTAASMEGK